MAPVTCSFLALEDTLYCAVSKKAPHVLSDSDDEVRHSAQAFHITATCKCGSCHVLSLVFGRPTTSMLVRCRPKMMWWESGWTRQVDSVGVQISVVPKLPLVLLFA